MRIPKVTALAHLELFMHLAERPDLLLVVLFYSQNGPLTLWIISGVIGVACLSGSSILKQQYNQSRA